MGFLDRLAGGKRDNKESATDTLHDSVPSTSGSSEILKEFQAPVSAPTVAPTISTSMSEQVYDPYEGISNALGGKKAVFRLPQGPEFVFQEEAAVHRRSWGENLQFYTGLGYVGGEHAHYYLYFFM